MDRRLNLDETQKCLKAWRELRDNDALTLLTVCNMGLVKFLAHKYLGKGLTFDELVSAGYEGLIRAINKFDYQESHIQAFSTYISVVIENAIRAELKQYNKHSHILSFEQPLGKNQDGEELIVGDIVGSDEDEMEESVFAKVETGVVFEVLKSLTTRERQILLLRYGFGGIPSKTQAEIAQIFGCSRAAVAMHEKKALIKLRQPRNAKKLKDFLH